MASETRVGLQAAAVAVPSAPSGNLLRAAVLCCVTPCLGGMFPEEYSSWGTFGAIGTTASGAYHCVLAVHLDSKYSCLSGLLQAALRLERSPSYRIPGTHAHEWTTADDELPRLAGMLSEPGHYLLFPNTWNFRA